MTPLAAGHFHANYADLVQGGEDRQVRIPDLVFLINHPDHGLILFDAGLGLQFRGQLAHSWIHRFFQMFLPYELGPGETAVEQLAANGIFPQMVRFIILSHFHYDHTSGLADFPNATVVASADEWKQADVPWWRAELRGYRKDTYQGIESRLQVVEYPPASPYGPFDDSFDLFGDGSLILLDTPGHTPGHQSLLVKEATPCPNMAAGSVCDVLLTGDAVWTSEGYRRPAPKGWKARWFEENADEAWITTQKIHQFHQENLDVVILPSHE